MSFENLVEQGKLLPEPTSPEEIKDLITSSDSYLTDSRSTGISIGLRFNAAYQSALLSAKAALRACGYRTVRGGGHHNLIIFSLPLTIGTDSQMSIDFQTFSHKRHRAFYESIESVSEQELREMIELAEDLRQRVEEWLKANHPELLEESLP